jgi:GDP-4-dehydro-6-deoxy-D-mannose reductase
MRCLITGIAGFTGRHLARFLAKEKRLDVYGIVRTRSTVPDATELLCCDVRDHRRIKSLVCKIRPRYIFHLAGLVGKHDLHALLEVNVLGTEAVLRAAAEVNAAILIPGSAAEYGATTRIPVTEDQPVRPVTLYGLAKAAQIHLALQTHQSGACAVFLPRPFNIAGPNQPTDFVCAELAQKVAALAPSQPLRICNGSVSRDFVDVRDLVKAYWLIMRKGTPGEIYNICTGVANSVAEVARVLLECRGINARIEETEQNMPSEPATVVGCLEKIRREVGWQPTIDFRNMLCDTMASLGTHAGRRKILEAHRK